MSDLLRTLRYMVRFARKKPKQVIQRIVVQCAHCSAQRLPGDRYCTLCGKAHR